MRVKGVLGLAILAAVLCVSGNVFAVLSGSGTEASPYLIQSRADFDEFANPANAALYWASGVYTRLMCNLDLAGTTYTQAVIAPDTNPSDGFQDSTPFSGIFDGNGHILFNLKISTSSHDFIGFFGYVGSGGQVKNLGMQNVNIRGEDHVGGLVGWNDYGTLTGCYVTGSVVGSDWVGGLAGNNHFGTITACYAMSSVSGGYSSVGGLVGDNNLGTLTTCYATGLVSGDSNAGGLVGYDYQGGAVIACFWDVQTSGTTDGVGNKNPDPSGAIGKTTEEMKNIQTYPSIDWSFIQGNNTDGDWIMPEGSYPKLVWEVYPMVTIPNLKGLTEEQARNVLDTTGLLSGEKSSVYDVSITVGLVSGTYPKAGTVVYSGLTPPIRILLANDIRYSGGDGVILPYQIAHLGDLIELMNTPADWSKSFILAANVDLAGTVYTQAFIAPDTSTLSGFQGTPFTGVFDGGGHTISNLTITASTKEHIGLFGCIGSGGQAYNLGLADVNITGRNNVGGLAGESSGAITACYVAGSVNGDECVGGLVGSNSGLLTSCYATGSVGVIDIYSYSTGGLVGSNGGLLTSCYATGVVNGNYSVGGLIGDSGGSVTACYASSIVDGIDSVGGLVGYTTGSFACCYATGSVCGSSSVGGLIGFDYGNLLIGCFWDIQTCFPAIVGVGSGVSNGVTGKTTAEMQTLSTFIDAGWDFVGESANGLHNFWQMGVNAYPCMASYAWTLAGEGTFANPYIVSHTADLGKVWLKPSACYRLSNNLDLSGISWSFAVVPAFSGDFDGRGFIVSHLTIDQPNSDSVSLFGKVESGGQIRNLGIENVNITGGDCVGGLAGVNNGTLTSCHAIGSVSSVSNYCSVGGLVGNNVNGKITSSYSGSSVSGTGNSCSVGGLVGVNNGPLCSLTSCYATGSTFGGTNSSVGGLSGKNTMGIITACYATGSVSGTSVGGLIGANNGSALVSCYATGLIDGTSSVGGLIGDNLNSTLIACFWDIQTSEKTIGVGSGSSEGATGKTTTEMMTVATFLTEGWDFVNEVTNGLNDYWKIEVNDYPRLTIPTWTLGGEGTTNDPYIIATAADLGKVWLRPVANYCLGSNLDLSGISWSSAVIPIFDGVFDGKKYIISHLTINQPNNDFIGLIGCIDVRGQIMNTVIKDINITGGYMTGGLAGKNYGVLTDCQVKGSVVGTSEYSFVGGLAGENFGGTLTSCHMDGSVSGKHYVGGLVGFNEFDSIISSCYATGFVNGIMTVGGLTGRNFGVLNTCYMAGSVRGTAVYSYVGGLAGENGGALFACYATGPVSGIDYVGGLVGYDSQWDAITACFWDKQTSGMNDGVGNVEPDIAGVIGKTTAEMKTRSTFTDAGWDFTNETANGSNDTWRMCADNVDTPRLNWESIEGDFACPEGVGTEDLDYTVGRWLRDDCTSANNFCGGADMNFSGVVNLADFAIFAAHWMEGS